MTMSQDARGLDSFEVRILQELQQDSRLTAQELSEKVGLSASPCWRRLKRLQDDGFIQRYTVLLDPQKAGVPECVFTHVTLTKHDLAGIEEFERAVSRRPEVLECYSTTGDADYLLRVVARDVRQYEQFLRDVIFTQKAVSQVKSNFALRAVKYETALPVHE
ncbi:AsnC family transcriptional regulator [Rhodospirillales bacterium TMPK1]|uniref:AsnC family transcriptional regulator n=2 Tax=Roseiterribacter gracilis TaxID=2812848 RepID=A0A8S8X9M7_9PROT|nr:AsnC family transcriptional regulator [Rhodospirillales bacterium TMPK1]